MEEKETTATIAIKRKATETLTFPLSFVYDLLYAIKSSRVTFS